MYREMHVWEELVKHVIVSNVLFLFCFLSSLIHYYEDIGNYKALIPQQMLIDIFISFSSVGWE